MLVAIENVLTVEAAGQVRSLLMAADWEDGNATSGEGSALAKVNRQLPESSAAAQQAQALVAQSLANCPAFLSAALPHTVFPPLFNRYGPGEKFGLHVDNAVRIHGPSGTRIRTDLSATLFLTDPQDYDGGELEIEGAFGMSSYKLPAGHMLIYPSSSLHRVTEVVRGERVSCFFWVQSLVGDSMARETLYELDQAIQVLTLDRGGDEAEVLRLTGIYHNLMRRWAVC